MSPEHFAHNQSRPESVVRRLHVPIQRPAPLPNGYLVPGDLRTVEAYARVLRCYRTDHLRGMDATSFRRQLVDLMSRPGQADPQGADTRLLRDQTGRFVWGHHHDFGAFKVRGQMGNRHLVHLAVLAEHFGEPMHALQGKQVLDIGCWTGGTSLLLAALGAHVVAVDEVAHYIEAVELLRRAFDVTHLVAENRSLYELRDEALQDRFDHVLFAGVLYHLTDPIVALSILFNTLRDGGSCWLETTGHDDPSAVFSFERRRWNWFDPSPAALRLLMHDVGFRQVRVGPVPPNGRLYAVGVREQHCEMRRDGLSVPDLR